MASLGEPVKDKFWFTGNISVSGSSGNADFAIPVSGPKGSATVYVVAKKSAGTWHYETLVVKVDGREAAIDLAGKTAN